MATINIVAPWPDVMASQSGSYNVQQQSMGACVCLAPKAANQHSVINRKEIAPSDFSPGQGYTADPSGAINRYHLRWAQRSFYGT